MRRVLSGWARDDAVQSGLSRRLGILLSVALLPLGLIALHQTLRLEDDLRAQSERALLATTLERAEQERLTIREAFGAAEALSIAAQTLADDAVACSDHFNRFVESSDEGFVFAGVIGPTGMVVCSSEGQTFDFGDSEDFQQIAARPRPRVDILSEGRVTGRNVVVVTLPYGPDETAPDGYISVSLPHYQVAGAPDQTGLQPGRAVFTINRLGEVLTSSEPLETAEALLPQDRVTHALAGGGSRQFTAPRGDGTPTLYTVVPIVEGTMYAIGAWADGTVHRNGVIAFFQSPALFAVFMWLASLILVTYTVERQVVGPVRILAARMRRFGRKREIPPAPKKGLPEELQIIEREFRTLSERLIQDEADLVNAMHEKDVLLKEIHHRVKNNLQLISSMINMQERRAEEHETVTVLDHINQRVASMATVHRLLYQADALSEVRAEDLLKRVTSPLTELAPPRPGEAPLTVDTVLDPTVMLYPDQALPLALLTVEAVTNALKYADDTGSGRWVRISLRKTGRDAVALVIANSVAPQREVGPKRKSLGARLIESFARQLGSTSVVSVAQGVHTLRVDFETMAFEAAADRIA